MAPENTLAALRRAHALGCRWVEFDVRLTSDGALILLHDDRLERTTNGCGIARRYLYRQFVDLTQEVGSIPSLPGNGCQLLRR